MPHFHHLDSIMPQYSPEVVVDGAAAAKTRESSFWDLARQKMHWVIASSKDLEYTQKLHCKLWNVVAQFSSVVVHHRNRMGTTPNLGI